MAARRQQQGVDDAGAALQEVRARVRVRVRVNSRVRDRVRVRVRVRVRGRGRVRVRVTSSSEAMRGMNGGGSDLHTRAEKSMPW